MIASAVVVFMDDVLAGVSLAFGLAVRPGLPGGYTYAGPTGYYGAGGGYGMAGGGYYNAGYAGGTAGLSRWHGRLSRWPAGYPAGTAGYPAGTAGYPGAYRYGQPYYNPGGIGGPASGLGVRPGLGVGG